jgi:hypothetical protein
MLKAGFAMHKENRLVRAVTHAPRNQLAMEVVGASSRAAASDILNHKSKSALSYYVPPEPVPTLPPPLLDVPINDQHWVGSWIGFIRCWWPADASRYQLHYSHNESADGGDEYTYDSYDSMAAAQYTWEAKQNWWWKMRYDKGTSAGWSKWSAIWFFTTNG